jgi:hypothetical protein
MTDVHPGTSGPGTGHEATTGPADWIRAISAGLTATGLSAGTNGNHVTGLDVTAIARPAGRTRAEIMLDEDGYTELRWFTDLTAPPADVTDALTRILAAIAATPSVLALEAAAPPKELS